MHEPIRVHLEAIDSARHAPRLLDARMVTDGTHPAGREWVRRWGPARALAMLPDCACAVGRCAICN